ncbi:hypothetical protein [Streptomyces sp. NPDC013181]|uniref:hypothetical protein n=1 Tax=Streptomyces sp. NPDC013181 TaxID=3364864 RepID=UPI0036939BEA
MLAAAAGTLVATVAIPMAFAADTPAFTTSPEAPPSAIEDFTYPGADAILATKGIELKKGDGHILLTDCDYTVDQIRVLTVADTAAGRAGTYCFHATGTTGYLTLSLPRVFALEAADHPLSADLTANGQTQTVDLEKGGWESVGEGTVGGARSILVEIRVTG